MEPAVQSAIIAAIVALTLKGMETIAARIRARTDTHVGLRQAELDADRQYRAALDADETEFRKTLLGENRMLATELAAERKRGDELSETVRVQGRQIDEQKQWFESVTKQLSVITLQRDSETVRADKLEKELNETRKDLESAKRRIAELQRQVALLERKPNVT